jgi:hypothetical protein
LNCSQRICILFFRGIGLIGWFCCVTGLSAQARCNATEIWNKWEFNEGLPLTSEPVLPSGAMMQADFEKVKRLHQRIKNHLNSQDVSGQYIEIIPFLGALSGWDPDYSDGKGRVGYFALPYIVARAFDLNIDEFTDERRDLEKAASAAFAWFTHNAIKLDNNRAEAVIGFLSSPAAIKAAKQELQSTQQEDWFFALEEYIQNNFRLFRMTLVNFLCASEVYGKGLVSYKTDSELVNLKVTDTIHLGRVAAYLNLDSTYLRSLNPVYRSWIIPAASENGIVLPASKREEWESMPDSLKRVPVLRKSIPTDSGKVERATPSEPEWKWIKVKSGDTLTAIASRFSGVSVQDIMNWNNLRNDKIYIGQTLKIKVRG